MSEIFRPYTKNTETPGITPGRRRIMSDSPDA
jgi:hypothetical protein